MTNLFKTYLIEENDFVRAGLSALLKKSGCDPVTEFTSTKELNTIKEQKECDLLVLGAEGFSVEDTVSALKNLKFRFPHTRVLVIASDLNIEIITASFSAGADGFILKDISSDAFLGSLDLVMLGEKVFPTAMATLLLAENGSDVSNDNPTDILNATLSEREREVLDGLERGEANKIIARQLNITEATVKVHVKAILRKLRLNNRTQAAIWSVNNAANSMAAQKNI